MRKFDWRFMLCGLLLAVSVYVLVPTFVPGLPASAKKVFLTEPIKLGLDLQGGMHILLQVETDKAVESVLARRAAQIKESFNKKSLGYEYVRAEKDAILFVTPFRDKFGEMEKAVKDLFTNLTVSKAKEDEFGVTGRIEIDAKQQQQIKENAVKQAVETIRNRIDQFGVAEPIIHSQGTDQIVVELPGVKDPKRALDLIGKTAQLEFRLVKDAPGAGAETIPEKRVNRETGEIQQSSITVARDPIITGDMLQDAQVRVGGQMNQPYVWIKFDSVGARVFEQATGENVGRRMAIVLDGTSYSSPVIKDRIGGGECIIEGNFDHQEATDLAIVLRAGSLPAPVNVIQNVTVGPTLGQDSISKGMLTGAIAFVLVLVFMFAYYKGAGFISISVLVLNLVYLVALITVARFTLTLPGIAGIILLIGIGVDSNVLIFERIKEELGLGKGVRNGIDAGFKNAFWTIVDSHITTLITAAILFQFGTGPIKGFAVSLSIGIAINLFTVLVGTRAVYDYLIWNKKITKLSI